MKLPMFLTARPFHKSEAGAAVVETALVLPIFLLFLLGLMEFCRAYWTLNSMQLSIDEAGRYAMVHASASNAQIISAAKANLYGLDSTQFTVTATSQTTSGVTYKVITAKYTFSFIAPGVLPFGNINLSRSTTVPLIP